MPNIQKIPKPILINLSMNIVDDSIIYATAKIYNAEIYTQDRHFENLACFYSSVSANGFEQDA
ncbi:hypothetical protein R83H12_00761 [Fibrobacteria bacterium R8-3-H12]